MKKVITKNESETIKLGERIAKDFRGGEVIGLEGDLGAGKTTLIKGIARGLGIKKNITSPTFVIMKIYETDGHGCKTDGHGSQIKKNLKHQASSIKRLCHVDAYRISNGRELVDIGILEYINDPVTVVIIEWAEKVREILPPSASSGSRLRSRIIWVRMKYRGDENEREIEVGDPSTRLRTGNC